MISSIAMFMLIAGDTQLQDPLYRDEDISGMQLSVEARQLDNGDWEYLYTIVNPETNKGTIFEMRMDIRCFPPDQELAEVNEQPIMSPPPESEPYNSQYDLSATPRIYAYALLPEVTIPEFATQINIQWTMSLEPGESVEGLRLVSRAAPKSRLWAAWPAWPTSWWDYGKYFGQGVDLPNEEDFRIEGTIPGPGCSVVPEVVPTYPGSARKEPASINELLVYETPTQDSLQVEHGKDLEMIIHYSMDIDPSTFHVEPRWAEKYFSPSPGSRQELIIPVKQKRLNLHLSVKTVKDDKPRPEDEDDSSYMDRDKFSIRTIKEKIK